VGLVGLITIVNITFHQNVDGEIDVQIQLAAAKHNSAPHNTHTHIHTLHTYIHTYIRQTKK
jgi:hypothetical protein